MPALYEIAGMLDRAFEEAENYAREHEGELPEDLAMKLDSLEMAFEEKVGNVALVYKNYRSEAEMVKQEAQKLATRAKTLQNRSDWLKRYLDETLDYRPYKDAKTVIGWRRSEYVEIEDIERLPQAYIKTEVRPDKENIKRVLKRGDYIGGAVLKERMNITIK